MKTSRRRDALSELFARDPPRPVRTLQDPIRRLREPIPHADEMSRAVEFILDLEPWIFYVFDVTGNVAQKLDAKRLAIEFQHFARDTPLFVDRRPLNGAFR